MTRLLLTALLMAVTALPLMGCIATAGGNASRDINDLKQSSYQARKDIAENTKAIKSLRQAQGDMPRESSLSAIRQSQTTLLNRLNNLHEEVQSMMQTVEGDLNKSQKLSRETAASLDVLKASASTDSKVSERLAAIEAELALIKKKLQWRDTVTPTKSQGGKPSAEGAEGAEGEYQSAYGVYKKKNYAKARTMFKTFLKSHKGHKWAGNAQFWIGETYFAQGTYDSAILAYHDVINKYKKSNKVADAMYKQGYAFIKLGDPLAAKGVLGQLVQKFPDSKAAEHARSKLKGLK